MCQSLCYVSFSCFKKLSDDTLALIWSYWNRKMTKHWAHRWRLFVSLFLLLLILWIIIRRDENVFLYVLLMLLRVYFWAGWRNYFWNYKEQWLKLKKKERHNEKLYYISVHSSYFSNKFLSFFNVFLKKQTFSF